MRALGELKSLLLLLAPPWRDRGNIPAKVKEVERGGREGVEGGSTAIYAVKGTQRMRHSDREERGGRLLVN